MIGDISLATNIYIITGYTGLSSGFIYPHLL